MALLVVFFVYFLILFFTYGKLPFTFFQQDEWLIFGNYLYWQKAHLDWFERLFVYGQYTHFIPLSNIFSFTQFRLFGLGFYPYAISSIFLHFINSLLVFYLGRILFKKNILAFLAGLFFLINSISHQATTWIATAPGTQGSVFFLLLCLIFFTKYLADSSKRKKYLYISLLFLAGSLFFKETSVFIFLFLPIYGLIMKSNKIKGIVISLIVLALFYVSLRAIIPIFPAQPAPNIPELAQPNLKVYAYRVITMPLRVLAQSIIPVEYIIGASNLLIKTAYPQFVAVDNAPNPYIVESLGADIISFSFAAIILIGSYGIYIFFKKRGEDSYSRVLLLAIVFIGLSSLPFVLVPGKAGFLSLLDSRHFYLTGIFTSILLTTISLGLYEIFSRKRFVLVLLTIFVICFSILNISKIRSDISKQIEVGQLRERLLNEVLSKYPRLPDKIVFYIPSDKSFYGVEENIMPFQSGFGQTLLVWYNAHGESFPACFFGDQFLYVQLSQGYRECEGRGFGYYRDIAKLKETLKLNAIDKSGVIGFHYRSADRRFIDITKELRERVL